MLAHRLVAYRPRNPLNEFSGLHRHVNRLFGEVAGDLCTRTKAQGHPPVNVWASDTDLTVQIEVPGVDHEKLDISVLGDTLTIAGAEEPAEAREGSELLHCERSGGEFSRTIRLPFEVADQKIEATYDRGILEITLPKAAKAIPQKIAIKSDRK